MTQRQEEAERLCHTFRETSENCEIYRIVEGNRRPAAEYEQVPGVPRRVAACSKSIRRDRNESIGSLRGIAKSMH